MHITHLHLNTAAALLNAQRTFYEDGLGLRVTAESDRYFTVQAGGTLLTFNAGEREYRYHFAFNIPQNQIEQARVWVGERHPLIEHEGTVVFQSGERWNAHQFYFTDPAGNILECIARHRLPNASTEPFSPAALLNISEIGVATADVRATVAVLEADYGLPVFDGRESETFSAVGDDDGLLIVVKEGRIWFPETGVPAVEQPLRVEMGSGRTLMKSEEI